MVFNATFNNISAISWCLASDRYDIKFKGELSVYSDNL
jgi:hypothetical protein